MKNDGGSAFPLTVDTQCGSKGATLLDLFAAHVSFELDEGLSAEDAAESVGMDMWDIERATPLTWSLFWAEVEARWRYIKAAAMVAEKRRREAQDGAA